MESVLLQHAAVAESAVVGYPDEERGEVVKAFIVLAEQYRERNGPALIEEIQDFVKRNTAPYKYPRLVSHPIKIFTLRDVDCYFDFSRLNSLTFYQKM